MPDDAVPKRKPVASPEILATPAGASIAGWEQLTIELSAGGVGLRVVLVVLDATNRPISVSDSVLYRSARSQGVVECRHESLGGRLEEDGSFRGTRWVSVTVEREEAGAEEEPRWESTPSQPSEADAAGLKALVAEVLRRRPSQSC